MGVHNLLVGNVCIKYYTFTGNLKRGGDYKSKDFMNIYTHYSDSHKELYEDYFKSLEEHKIIKDEYQVTHGFSGMGHIKLLELKWYDTGNNKSYEEVRKDFPNEVVANKSDEVLFIDNGKVVKYFNNKDIVEEFN